MGSRSDSTVRKVHESPTCLHPCETICTDNLLKLNFKVETFLQTEILQLTHIAILWYAIFSFLFSFSYHFLALEKWLYSATMMQNNMSSIWCVIIAQISFKRMLHNILKDYNCWKYWFNALIMFISCDLWSKTQSWSNIFDHDNVRIIENERQMWKAQRVSHHLKNKKQLKNRQ